MQRLLLPIIVTVASGLAALPTPAQAVSIDFVPAFTEILIGDSVNVEIVISGLAPGDSLPVGFFDIVVRFDSSILESSIQLLPTSTVFGPTLGIPGTQSTAVWGAGFDSNPDTVKVYESSSLYELDLIPLQSPAFTLATLRFSALAVGTSSLIFESLTIRGARITDPATGALIEIASTGAGRVSVVRRIPEPTTLALFVFGLAGLGFTRRKAARQKITFAVPKPDAASTAA